MPPANPNVVMGLYFFPRGGSAHVARHLCHALGERRIAPILFAGSIGTLAETANAHRFFRGIRCESLDYSPALSDWSRGDDPMAAAVPMHASFEDKPGVPDRIFFELDDAAFDRQVASWTRLFGSCGNVCPSVVHLHHLTPMHEAVRILWPNVPVITHLHGTELKMLASVHEEPPPGSMNWTRAWVERMRRWAVDSDRLVVVSAHDDELVQQVLSVEPARVSTIANGVDTDVFSHRVRSLAERLECWRRFLVDDPQGWRPGCREGSIRYHVDDLAAFVDHDGQRVPVVVFAGRFLRFKRLRLLIEAHHAMRSVTERRSVLVVVGGFPGEWEGEHPYDTVQRLGAHDVFFVGWRDHCDLADILNCSDVFAAPAVDEPFGLVYLEAMAAGLPPIATSTGGPLSFINIDPGRPTGWLVPPEDVAATARAVTEAITDRASRVERGRRAATYVRENYSWAFAAEAFAGLYAEVIDGPSGRLGQAGQPTRGVA